MDPQQTPSQHGGMARPVALLALLLCCASTAAAWVVPALACARGGAAQRSGVLRLRANRAAPRARPPERNRAVLRLARRALTLRAHDCASLFHSLVDMCKCCGSSCATCCEGALLRTLRGDLPEPRNLSRLVVTLSMMLTTWLLPPAFPSGDHAARHAGPHASAAWAAVSSEEARVKAAKAAERKTANSVVAEAWRTLDKAFVDKKMSGNDWAGVRRQFVRADYQSTEEAYAAVRDMTALLGDKFTRFLTPAQARYTYMHACIHHTCKYI